MSVGTYFGEVNAKDHTLLIVDDEADLRDILAFQFRRDGFKVLEAANGREAFAIVKSNKIDLVITDIKMPGGNGIELLDKVREHDRDLPVVVFLTGFADISVEAALNKGAEAVFAKPFDRRVLLNTVYQALMPKEERWSARQWRGETALPVEISAPGFEGTRRANVTNLGPGGIFISIEKNVPRVGDKVSFKLHFSEGAVLLIEGQGIVRWVRANQGDFPSGCGIEFVELNDHSRTKIIELINFLKTEQYIPKN